MALPGHFTLFLKSEKADLHALRVLAPSYSIFGGR